MTSYIFMALASAIIGLVESGGKMRRKLIRRFEKLVFILEMIIVAFIVIGIIIGMTDFVYYFRDLISAETNSYELFEAFLAYSLILIVGIELILMLLYHSTRAILELILFVIARKMLVYSHTMLDLVLGTLAILMVFAILRYLLPNEAEHDIVRKVEKTYLPNVKMADIFEDWDESYDYPLDMTVADYILDQSKELDQKVEVTTAVGYKDKHIEVLELDEEGNISRVSVY